MDKVHIQEGYGQNYRVFFDSHAVQTIERDRELWFLASDLGRMLDLTNVRKNLRELREDEKDWCYIEPKEPKWGEVAVTFSYSNLHRIRVRVVNEPGLYRLVFMSRMPAAKQFQDWAVRDVLPRIRKTGQYKHRKTTPLVFIPKTMPEEQSFKLALRERPVRFLSWIEPYVPSAEEQAAFDAEMAAIFARIKQNPLNKAQRELC